jgi:hypothetical protein
MLLSDAVHRDPTGHLEQPRAGEELFVGPCPPSTEHALTVKVVD